MITLQQCITSARVAADAVWGTVGPRAFTWQSCLTANRFQAKLARRGGVPADIGCSSLAQFLSKHRDATAEDLFRFAIADEIDPMSWNRAPPSLRAAVEVFRATFLVLLRLHEADEADAAGKKKVPELTPVNVKDWRKAYSIDEVEDAMCQRAGKDKVKEAVDKIQRIAASVELPPPPAPAPPPEGTKVGYGLVWGNKEVVTVPILEERGRKYPRRNPRNGGKA